MPAEPRLKTYVDLVDQRLDEILPPLTKSPTELHEAMRYSALAPGKRLRPALVMASSEAVGGDAQTVLDAACAVELVHCFSLIHDDLPAIDNDDLRRGLPTCHVKFGEAIAILAGDALFSLAFQVLSDSCGSPDRVIQSVRILSRSTGSDGLVGGEVVDVLSEGRPVTEGAVRFIHERKTGSLISACCEIGGLLGGASDEEMKALSSYGKHLGLAFQIADDLLNELSTREQLGKAAGSDRERSKATFPALFGIEESQRMAIELAEEATKEVRGLGRPEVLLDLARYSIERLH